MNGIKILGAGHYVPNNIIKNEDFANFLDTSDEWIKTRTGINERRFSLDEKTSDLAYEAAKIALIKANVNPEQIELVICATITGDNFTPAVSQIIMDKLRINKAMSFDINAACSGFVYAMNTAIALMNENNYSKALVIGAEVFSKILDFNDRNTAVLFGDGAGAVVIENTGNSRFYCQAKTDKMNVLYAKSVDSNKLFNNSIMTDHYLKMDGKEVFKFALTAMEDAIIEILKKVNLSINDIDLIIPHQANIRIIQSVSKKLGVDINKFYLNLEKYGNTSAASIPIALSEAIEKNIIKKEQKIIFVGFGAGLTWASMYIEI